jgi:hypothetical protein
MELKLIRREFSEHTTLGELYMDGEFICYVLEDCDRGLTKSLPLVEIERLKVYGKTCIPYGKYEIAITYSGRFKKPLPLVMGVPGYEGIRIHPGNTEFDTLGCLLPGKKKSKDRVSESTLAFNELYTQLESYLKREKVYLTIEKATQNVIHHA